jgi:hypothetical protein
MSTEAETLSRGLLGAWSLVSYVQLPVGGGDDRYPLGEDAEGILMYTPDGFMSAQLMRRGRPELSSGDWFDATDEEARAEASGYIAYSGPFHVDADGTLTHTMTVSLHPNWIGQTQPRIADLHGDTLRLSTASPIRSQGVEVHSYLTWRRIPPSD